MKSVLCEDDALVFSDIRPHMLVETMALKQLHRMRYVAVYGSCVYVRNEHLVNLYRGETRVGKKNIGSLKLCIRQTVYLWPTLSETGLLVREFQSKSDNFNINADGNKLLCATADVITIRHEK
jgi:hypothetical protein